MNKALLHKEVQDYIAQNYTAEISKIIFKGSPFRKVSIQELATQLVGKKKAKKKLPTWFKTPGVIYPPKLNLEQTSSETTAQYKSSLIDGNSIIDITGGFGVDAYFFAKKFKKTIHCELNPELSMLVAHNAKLLGVSILKTLSGDGIEFLKTTSEEFNWIYLDPSRRDDAGGKVFLLSDCLPNVPEHLELLFEKSSNILIKTSPLLDLQAGISALKNVREIHIVAIKNEVKELLWILKKGYSEEIRIKTINFKNKGNEVYENQLGTSPEVNLSTPLAYLYEPNAATMKSGLFHAIGGDFDLKKLHPNTHLFTSKELIDFPGRRFEVLNVLPFRKKEIKAQLTFKKAHIATRNFPETVATLRNQFKLNDGGAHYLFFTTTGENEKKLLICKKV